tara:strand:- start:3100 stop:5253 length:2154 start_codon:yes stop_codon:yes gene_type:complete
MKKVAWCGIVFGLLCGMAHAQKETGFGENGVYVEVYNTSAQEWQHVAGFPNRYRLDDNGDPDPETGLLGSELDKIQLNTVDGLFYSIGASFPLSTDIGDIEILSGNGIVFIGRDGLFNGPTIDRGFRLSRAGCRNLGSLKTFSTEGIVKAYLTGDVLGSFQAHDIANLECDVIRGSVIDNPANLSATGDLMYLRCSTIASNASVTSNYDSIALAQITGVVGTLETTNGGGINTCEIGSLRDGKILVDGNLNDFDVLGDVWGEISVGGIVFDADVGGSWGLQGATPRSIDASGVNTILELFVLEDFVGDLSGVANAGLNLTTLTVDGFMYNYDSMNNLVPATILSNTNMTRFTNRGRFLPAVQETRLDLEAPTVKAYFHGPQFDHGLVNLTNGVPEFFVDEDGDTEVGKFRFAHGLGAGAQVHFGYDPADPAAKMGLTSRRAFLNFNNYDESLVSWDGKVSVGPTPLDTDPDTIFLNENYTVLSGEIGGGSFGRAPFNFHQRTTAPPDGIARDCSPYHTEAFPIGAFDKFEEVTISHYGPVYVDGTGPHFRVEFKPPFSSVISDEPPYTAEPWVWEDRTSSFEVDTTRSGTDAASAHQKIVIRTVAGNTTGFKSAAGQWRIRPLVDKVRCSTVTNDPNVKYDSNVKARDLDGATGDEYSWYAFRTDIMSTSGMMLLSGGNGPTAADLSTWLSEPYETNGDGTTDYRDFMDIAEAYIAD